MWPQWKSIFFIQSDLPSFGDHHEPPMHPLYYPLIPYSQTRSCDINSSLLSKAPMHPCMGDSIEQAWKAGLLPECRVVIRSRQSAWLLLHTPRHSWDVGMSSVDSFLGGIKNAS